MKELLVIFLSLIISGTVLLLHHDSFIQLNTDFSTNHHEDNGEFVCRCDSENCRALLSRYDAPPAIDAANEELSSLQVETIFSCV